MLKKVEDEPAEFAELRRSLVTLCEVSKNKTEGSPNMSEKKRDSVSIRISKKVWHDYRVYCAVHDLRIGEYLEQIIEAAISGKEGEGAEKDQD